MTNLFGLETKLPAWLDPTNLAGTLEQDRLQGRRHARPAPATLTAVMTARVAEVLPNGDLVLEGVREIDINGDRQIVVLTGVVRPSGHRAEQRRAVARRSASCAFATSAAG